MGRGYGPVCVRGRGAKVMWKPPAAMAHAATADIGAHPGTTPGAAPGHHPRPARGRHMAESAAPGRLGALQTSSSDLG